MSGPALALAAALAVGPSPAAGTVAEQLATRGMPPADYVLAKLREHRVVLLGEHHWIRQDAALVRDLVPRLAGAGVTTLALETLPASAQARLDRLTASGTWDAAEAIAVLRAAAWPYREYLEIVRAVGDANRAAAPGAPRLRLLALGPGADWRERLLPIGKTYDSFMAEKVLAEASDPTRRILVYAGVNHAFTRFEQPELPRGERVERFMERMGNILRRELGEESFLVMLHRPWRCREGAAWKACLPLGGALDCAAAVRGVPVGFDVAGTPAGDLPVGDTAYYSLGSPGLRFGEVTDGAVWWGGPGRLEGVGLIPLEEFAPDETSLAEVADHNPLSDETGLERARIQALWDKESAALADPSAKFGWKDLAGSDPCARGDAGPSASAGTLRIFLARHGQTDWNAVRRLQGSTDIPLNDLGRAQARALAEKTARVPLDAIYASGLARSLETARIVARGRRVESLPQLNEQSLGSFEGKQIGEKDAATAAEFERRRSDPDDRLDGGESLNQHRERVEAALALLQKRHPSGSILIIGHGGTNALLLGALLGLSAEQAREIRQDNSELYLIEIVPGQEAPVLWKEIPKDRLGEL